jgi:autotransporter-associated beta strand protein
VIDGSLSSAILHHSQSMCSDVSTRKLTSIAAAIVLFCPQFTSVAQGARSLGIDVSTYQGNISAANWATLKRATNVLVGGVFGDGRDFVMIRSTRGGTTGEDHRQGGYPSGNNTFFDFSQRYDDPYYVQNINRATAAGLFAGTYHFSRPDILASTTNSDGVTTAGTNNTGTDEANHMLQMASPWMRPGFLPPALDLEVGDGIRTDNEMAQFCVDFSDRIFAVMGVRPAIYINGNYAANILQTATSPSPTLVVADYQTLWSARWPNQTNVSAIDVQNGNPKDSYPPIYGPWDDPPNPTHPWKLWQYASTGRVNAIGGGGSNCDVDVAHGGVEYLKDLLIPALWMNDSSGDWSTLTNWNSGQTPIAPVPGVGQLTPIGTQTLPTPRLPGANDSVILDRGAASVTVTLSSGTHNIRKLYMRETLNITGGSLTINYIPSWDSTTNSAQFSGPVSISGGASLSVPNLLLDATRMFTVNGCNLAFNTLTLMNDVTTPATLMVGGDVNFNSVTGTVATITRSGGAGSSGLINLGAASHAFNVTNGAELFVSASISNGGLIKTGQGALRLTLSSSYAGGTTVSNGTLFVDNTIGSATGSGAVAVYGGTLGGTGIISGPVTIASGGTLSPGSSTPLGTLTINTAPTLNGTNFVQIDRNGVSPLADKINLTAGTLTYGGTLVVSNSGAALLGGEMFTNFVAPAYAGAFAATLLPTLDTGLNWYLGDLTSYGRIKVNRSPAPGPALFFTNTPGAQLQIPIANLVAGASDPDGDAVTLSGIYLTTTNGVTLVTNGTTVFYSNNGNPADSFSFTITDGHGGSATGAVLIAASTIGQFISPPSVSASSITLHFVGGPGLTYYLERSINLPPEWATISTNVVPASGILDYLDDFRDLSGPPSSSFYRLRW